MTESTTEQSLEYSPVAIPRLSCDRSVSTQVTLSRHPSMPNHCKSLLIRSSRDSFFAERPKTMMLYPFESKEAIRWLPRNPVVPVSAITGLFFSCKVRVFYFKNKVNFLSCRIPDTKHKDAPLQPRF